jgi:hypothetical protein
MRKCGIRRFTRRTTGNRIPAGLIRWVLYTGIWNDNAYWDDSAIWRDEE